MVFINIIAFILKFQAMDNALIIYYIVCEVPKASTLENLNNKDRSIKVRLKLTPRKSKRK